jgi:hypothetical protein
LPILDIRDSFSPRPSNDQYKKQDTTLQEKEKLLEKKAAKNRT